ncbi:peptidyl-prolyl cis-trans isomerase, FKBP-type [Oleiphilus messinensis]|uniref:Peptidyl-prolyl cis-trans isomerase n=1 Tax=Oleiphilus messinensis TaxID=141451 RepID=A0A1Y0I556_9GAMM|nr:peptidylprolyl isomerase [Oleiphilus messinensis]ARU54916.1 peptidyl-prolyl cis-trans isomerase, FKBP-type [Oleiphilus messinensis]
MTDNVVKAGVKVTLNFSLKLENGDIVDTTFDKKPAVFEMGDGNLPEAFEKLILGMSSGQRSEFNVRPEDGFGQHNPNNVQQIPRTQFGDDVLLEPGLLISFADAGQNELPGMVVEYDDQNVTIDFNHPLAGRALLFEAEIVQIDPVD